MRIMTLLAAGWLACGCVSGSAFAQTLEKVTIAHTPSVTGGVPKIAQQLGLFEKHGLSAELVQMESANATATALVSGSVDAALSGPGELIAAQARGVPMLIVANVYNGLNGSIMMSRAQAEKLGVKADAPVEERLRALDGLTMASTSPTSSWTVAARGSARAAGADVDVAFMGQPSMQAAMESGAVQAYVAGAPFWTVPVLNDTGIVWISGPKGEFPKEYTPASAASLVALKGYTDARPETAERLAAVFAELADAFGSRPDDVKAAIRKAFPGVGDKAIETFYDVEAPSFMARPLTVEDMAHEIAFVKLSDVRLPNIDTLDPASMLLTRP